MGPRLHITGPNTTFPPAKTGPRPIWSGSQALPQIRTEQRGKRQSVLVGIVQWQHSADTRHRFRGPDTGTTRGADTKFVNLK